MRVLFFLPSLQIYWDRLRLVMEVSRRVDRLVLLVGSQDVEVDTRDYPNLALKIVGFRAGLWPWNIWKASRLAERLISEERISLVHDTYGSLLPLFARRGRFPATVFATSLFALSGWRRRNVFSSLGTFRMLASRPMARILLNPWVEREICRRADCVVLQSPLLIDRLLEDVPVERSRIRVLTNNVDGEFWQPSPEARPPRTAEGACSLLFVGEIYPGKGILVLAETLARLKQAGIRCVLRVVGRWVPEFQSDVLDALRRHALLEDVEFLGWVSRERLRELYRTSDLLVYQTRDDGSPRVVLEALACGLPVAASHHPGIDHVDPAGEFLAFSAFGDATCLATQIADLHKSPNTWAKRSRKGREQMLSRFSTAAVAESYVNLYRALLAERGTANILSRTEQ